MQNAKIIGPTPFPFPDSFQLDTSFNGSGFVGRADKGAGSGNGEFSGPFDVAVSRDGSQIAVSDSDNNRIQQFGSGGTFANFFGQRGAAVGQFNAPKGLVFDDAGYLYVVDSGNNRVCLALGSAVLGASGGAGAALGQFQAPLNVSVGERGIYVADTGNNRVQEFDPLPDGCTATPTPFSPRGSISSQVPLSLPGSASAVADLIEEELYVADTGNNRVVLVSLPANDPLSVWNSMVAHAAQGDVPGAILSFSRLTAEGYRQAFLTVGADDLTLDIGRIGPLTPVFIRSDEAEYYFEETVDGNPLLFRVEFVNENGSWKIMEF